MCTLRAMQRTNDDVWLTVTQRVISAVAVATLAACATRFDQAPVVDRSTGTQSATPSSIQGAAAPLPPPPPGSYRVKPGDNLYRIALDNGQNYRDLAAWNNVADPNRIEVGQVLRVIPPGANAAAANAAAVTPGVATAPIGGGAAAVQSAPLGSSSTPTASAASSAAPPIYGSATSATATAPQPPASAPQSGNIEFSWPVRGAIVGTFDDEKNKKGIDIGGTAGESVKAAADGRVVYAGNGLRGYGNLIIIKHDATYLTAYAHNRSLMVKEGDSVTKGQKIAEMGNSDADRVMLHFEVRRQGKPVDPMKYLPPQ
jgi:lipoprotein NlpD